MSPESARPRTAGTSMPGLHRSRSLASAPASRSAKARITPSTWSASSARGAPSSRTAWCSALDSGRRSHWSGRASSLPVPQPLRTAWPRSALSSTVLPTPRSPVSTSDRSGRPLRDPLQDDVEGAHLLVATGQLGRPLPGAGRVGVPDRVHARTVWARLADSVDFAESAFRLARRSGGLAGRRVAVRAVQAGPQHLDQLGDLVDREPERRGADVVAPHRQHDEVGLGVPGDPERAVVAAGVEEDRPQRRQRPAALISPSCSRVVPRARVRPRHRARPAPRLRGARAARGGSAGPRPQGPARRPRHRDGAPRGVQRAEDLRPAAARRSRARWSRTSPGTASSSTSSVGGLHLVMHLARAGWIRWKDEVPTLPPRPGSKRRSPRASSSTTTVRARHHRGRHQEEPGDLRRPRPARRPRHRQPRPRPAHRRLHPRAVPRRSSQAEGRKQIKGVLRHQGTIAGIGNAYSDEILHAARMSPFKPAVELLEATTTPTSCCTTRSGSPSATPSSARAGLAASELKGEKKSQPRRARPDRQGLPGVRRHRARGVLRRLEPAVLPDLPDRRQAARRPADVSKLLK